MGRCYPEVEKEFEGNVPRVWTELEGKVPRVETELEGNVLRFGRNWKVMF